MEFIQTKLTGSFIIEPKILRDERGYFMESFNERLFQEGIGDRISFVQDNQSASVKGVLRGLHYQTGAFSQAKLVRVLKGEVLDVAVDIRPDSPTFGQHQAVLLSEDNQRQFYIPKGFAHGFVVLSETAIFFYKCSDFYNRESEGGILFNDPALGIDWKLPEADFILSEKDRNLPLLSNARPAW
ncbi:dTDP-4-dehydrorhamnose 3,5-epimerase [Flavobacterium silvaticum]|uniref:dTDP-4-dehydrorhamnose 3,5-epimerase n=1 Tax=Flavobacterium silvaticum TaxID=1852020 RepID=A0A972JJS3_9FLAO|nr:dTDP-4-dehydrorhamnose 3,5-epimerase [Flavobacterium silvaticum]NMH28392.1 dTDP-4-dehydrorhamnose 3,5-epimerase [Flavobacterium silvaticum]